MNSAWYSKVIVCVVAFICTTPSSLVQGASLSLDNAEGRHVVLPGGGGLGAGHSRVDLEENLEWNVENVADAGGNTFVHNSILFSVLAGDRTLQVEDEYRVPFYVPASGDYSIEGDIVLNGEVWSKGFASLGTALGSFMVELEWGVYRSPSGLPVEEQTRTICDEDGLVGAASGGLLSFIVSIIDKAVKGSPVGSVANLVSFFDFLLGESAEKEWANEIQPLDTPTMQLSAGQQYEWRLKVSSLSRSTTFGAGGHIGGVDLTVLFSDLTLVEPTWEPDSVSVALSPNRVDIFESTTITATVTDTAGSPMQGVTVEFSSNGWPGVMNPTSDITDANGQATATFTPRTSGTACLISAQVSGGGPTGAASLAVLPGRITWDPIRCWQQNYPRYQFEAMLLSNGTPWQHEPVTLTLWPPDIAHFDRSGTATLHTKTNGAAYAREDIYVHDEYCGRVLTITAQHDATGAGSSVGVSLWTPSCPNKPFSAFSDLVTEVQGMQPGYSAGDVDWSGDGGLIALSGSGTYFIEDPLGTPVLWDYIGTGGAVY